MYMMVQIQLHKFNDEINSDLQFAQKLVNEQGVLMLPGKCFCAPGFVRIVLCHNTEFFETMIVRLKEFCTAYSI